MATFKHRIALRPEITASDARSVAWDRKWRLVELQKPDSDTVIDIWTSKDRATEIHLVDDRPIGMLYFTLYGNSTDSEAEAITELITPWQFSDAATQFTASENQNDKLLAVYAVALTASRPQEQQLLDLLQIASRDPDAAIRQSVVIAASYTPWPRILELIKMIRDNDTHEYVREGAQILLDGAEQPGEE